jgi:hypothetical protein
MSGALSDERSGLSFTVYNVQYTIYFTVSDLRPGPCIYITQKQGGPVIPPGTGSDLWSSASMVSPLPDNSSARTTRKTQHISCCRGMFTAPLHYLFLIGIVGGGVQLGPLGTAATNTPIVPAPAHYDDGDIGGKMTIKGNRSTRRKPAPVPLCPQQSSHATRTRTRVATVGSQRLTTWAAAQPRRHIETQTLHSIFLGVGVVFPVGSRIFSSARRPDRLWGPINLLSSGYRG